MQNPEIATVRVATGRGQNATGLCEERDIAVRSSSRVATERFVAFRMRRSLLSRQDLRMRPIGPSPSQGLRLTSTEKGHVAADEKGKKKSFLWPFHSSSATKSSSTRP
ncbi:hypothetical protein Taro_012325 [Colocasia esculenta]|uniref:Uncharacterized protein n=1 Tax=Colocasia esculenta TaxID=4460 RepID=A0A843UCM3_COLES|nr:hypothetical protein [Colocasia esculenta]